MTDNEFLLLNPGPVPVTRRVREAMDAPMVSHRSAEFEAIYERAQDGLDYVFEHSTLDGESTSSGGTSLVLNGTATMGMEAAVANLVGEDDDVVALVNGKFGRRFARIAARYASVTRVEVEWGDSLDPGDVAEAVSVDTDLVTMVHNETSTGILNPVPEVGEIAAAHDARFVVDGVTSIGGDVFRIDDWNVDIAITDSQKALAAPPGISAMYVTDRAIEHIDGERAPFYADLDWHIRRPMIIKHPSRAPSRSFGRSRSRSRRSNRKEWRPVSNAIAGSRPPSDRGSPRWVWRDSPRSATRAPTRTP